MLGSQGHTSQKVSNALNTILEDHWGDYMSWSWKVLAFEKNRVDGSCSGYVTILSYNSPGKASLLMMGHNVSFSSVLSHSLLIQIMAVLPSPDQVHIQHVNFSRIIFSSSHLPTAPFFSLVLKYTWTYLPMDFFLSLCMLFPYLIRGAGHLATHDPWSQFLTSPPRVQGTVSLTVTLSLLSFLVSNVIL